MSLSGTLFFLVIFCLPGIQLPAYAQLENNIENIKGELTGQYLANGNQWGILFDRSNGNPQEYVRTSASMRSADNYVDGDGNEVADGYFRTQLFVETSRPVSDLDNVLFNFDLSQNKNNKVAGSELDVPDAGDKKFKLAYTARSGVKPSDTVFVDIAYQTNNSVSDNYSLRTTSSTELELKSAYTIADFSIISNIDLDRDKLTAGLLLQSSTYSANRWINTGSGSSGSGSGGMGSNSFELESTVWPDVDIASSQIYLNYLKSYSPDQNFIAEINFQTYASQARNALYDPVDVALSAEQLYSLYYGTTDTKQDDQFTGYKLRYENSFNNQNQLYLMFSLSPGWAAVAEQYVAQNAATDDARWVGNPSLETERHQRLEFGLFSKTLSQHSRLSLYYDKVTDYILLDRAHLQSGVLLDDNALVYRNVDAALIGFEYHVSNKWSVDWASQFDVYYDYAQNITDDRPVAQIEPARISISLEKFSTSWSGGIKLRAAAKQSRVDDNELTGSGLDVEETAGYAVLDLYIHRLLEHKLRIEAGVNNVFDKTYANHLNAVNVFDVTQSKINEPGVSLWVKAGIQF